jgi:hypothetical protein
MIKIVSGFDTIIPVARQLIPANCESTFRHRLWAILDEKSSLYSHYKTTDLIEHVTAQADDHDIVSSVRGYPVCVIVYDGHTFVYLGFELMRRI